MPIESNPVRLVPCVPLTHVARGQALTCVLTPSQVQRVDDVVHVSRLVGVTEPVRQAQLGSVLKQKDGISTMNETSAMDRSVPVKLFE